MACETRRLSEAFFHSWKTAHSSERGFLQSKRLWHYPFSSQLKFIENIQENTARLISSQLACQKQTNTAITRTKKGNPSPAFWVHNRHLICCSDLQTDKPSEIYCDRPNGTKHEYNCSTHDHLQRKYLSIPHTEDAGRAASSDLLFIFAPWHRLMPNMTTTKPQDIIVYQCLKQVLTEGRVWGWPSRITVGLLPTHAIQPHTF